MKRTFLPAALTAAILSPILLTGCGVGSQSTASLTQGVTLEGKVIGGQQPVVGAHIYLFAANTTGYGNASTSLLNASSTGASDTLGAYVLTDANGGFTVTGDYTCTSGQQVYLYSLGGNPGLSGSNTNQAAAFMTTLGSCPSSGTFVDTVPFLYVNEVTTVATAYAIAGYAVDATHVASSASSAGATGMASAFANTSNLVDISTGVALTTTPSGAGVVPAATINTIANVLATCVNSGSSDSSTSTACSLLFSATTSDGTTTGTQPTDTAGAAINIAHHPATSTSNLFALQSATPPFVPMLSSQPKDFGLGVVFSGNGLNAPAGIAIDDAGNAWITNYTSPKAGAVVEISNRSGFLSGTTGFVGSNLLQSSGIAIDGLGRIWVSSYLGGSQSDGHIVRLDTSGAVVQDIDSTMFGPAGISVDGSNNLWIANSATNGASGQPNGVSEITAGGTVTSFPTYNSNTGLSAAYPLYVVNDSAGNVWLAGNGQSNQLTKLDNAGNVATSSPFTTGSVSTNGTLPYGMTIDGNDNVWVANAYSNTNSSVNEVSSDGTLLSGANGYASSLGVPASPVVDGLNTIWILSGTSNAALFQLAADGSQLTPSNGVSGGLLSLSAAATAVDASGNVWVADYGNADVVEYIGLAAPVITPIASALAAKSVGARP